MEPFVTSLRTYQLTKDVKRALREMDARLGAQSDLSGALLALYRQELIGAEHYVYLETRLLLNRFCRSVERLMGEGVLTGLYFYDQAEARMWIGAAPSLPPAYNEYAQGLSAVPDAIRGDLPVYAREVVNIGDVRSSDHIVAVNHADALLGCGLRSICILPLAQNDRVVGFSTMYSKERRNWRRNDLNLLRSSVARVERLLSEVQDRFIRASVDL